MLKKLLLTITIFVSACDTTPNNSQRVYRQPTPLEACVSDVRSDATICEFSALGSVKRGVPDSYHQCGIRRRAEEDRCRERFDPTYIRRSVPATTDVRPAPQQIIIQREPMNNPNACIQDGGGIYCPNYKR